MLGRDDLVKSAVQLLIGLLCGAAALLIILILSGSELDETSGKAVGTAATIAFFGLTSMAGIVLVNRRPEIAVLGYLTAALSICTIVFLIGAIWIDDLIDDWNIVGNVVVLAIAGGHASLLLAGVRNEDREAVRVIRNVTLLTLALLALLAMIEISSDGDALDPRLIAVVAVLYALSSILLPLVRWASPSSRTPQTGIVAVELLRSHGLVLVEGPRSRSGAHGPGQRVCLREPDGRLIELIAYHDHDFS
jgi:hypothetical protein